MKFINIFNVYKELFCMIFLEDVIYKKCKIGVCLFMFGI